MPAASPLPLALSLLAGCGKEPVQTPLQTGGYSLHRFSDCGELRARVAASWTEELLQSRYGWGWGLDHGASEDGTGGSAPRSYSETNVQEEGVDEPDLVKTDGEHLYIATGGALKTVRSWPAEETALLASLDLDGEVSGLFLDGDRALVLGQAWTYEDGDSSAPDRGSTDGGTWWWSTGDVPDWSGPSMGYRSSTKAWVVDVSDRGAPRLLRELDLEGWYVDARKVGSHVYLVTNRSAAMPTSVWRLLGALALPEPVWSDEAANEAAMAEARALLYPHVLARVREMDEGALLPEYRDRLPGEEGEIQLLTACEDVYRPDGLNSPGTLALTHIDLAEGEAGSAPTATGLLSYGWEVYASQDNLYISQTSGWWWGWDGETTRTHVHKFELDGAETRYAASGAVQGWLLNNYSMSEHEGDLRMGTSDSAWGWWGGSAGEAANHLFVLRETEGRLDTIGHLGGLAPGEQIYAMRFLGDTAFMVTFVQVDPLFTIDVSDPTDPRLVGELKIPGYSSYLHPAGEDHLLAVGMAGEEDGSITGFQVSLFDVSDLSAPTLAAALGLESDDWSTSEALWDPHAFTWFAGTLAVPVYTWDDATGEAFSGLWVLDVDLEAGALSELGRVGHADLVRASECPDDPYDDCYDDGDYTWMRRSVVIEDWLYSLSSHGIKVSALRDPSETVATVLFYPR